MERLLKSNRYLPKGQKVPNGTQSRVVFTEVGFRVNCNYLSISQDIYVYCVSIVLFPLVLYFSIRCLQ